MCLEHFLGDKEEKSYHVADVWNGNVKMSMGKHHFAQAEDNMLEPQTFRIVECGRVLKTKKKLHSKNTPT